MMGNSRDTSELGKRIKPTVINHIKSTVIDHIKPTVTATEHTRKLLGGESNKQAEARCEVHYNWQVI
jgi:hypothetical protein